MKNKNKNQEKIKDKKEELLKVHFAKHSIHYSKYFGRWTYIYALNLANLLHIENADSILDLACGCGLALCEFIRRKRPEAKLIGVDISA